MGKRSLPTTVWPSRFIDSGISAGLVLLMGLGCAGRYSLDRDSGKGLSSALGGNVTHPKYIQAELDLPPEAGHSGHSHKGRARPALKPCQCAVPGCRKSAGGHKTHYCNGHHHRFLDHGDVIQHIPLGDRRAVRRWACSDKYGPEHQRCSHCKEIRPRTDFHKSSAHPSGLQTSCYVCQHERWIKHNYGVTAKDYEAALKRQNYRCALCGSSSPSQHPSGRRTQRFFNVDHDHNTGQVRGLLCYTCNLWLGTIERGRAKVPADRLAAYLDGAFEIPSSKVENG